VVSTELSNLSDWCLTWASKGRPMPPEASAHFAKVLLDLSHQAKQLERLPCDDGALAYAEHDGDGC
jgi:hypothetical protein